MRKRLPKILVTGGAGFIGSALVRLILGDCRRGGLNLPYGSFIIVDKLTYAGDLKRLQEVKGKFKFYKTDICNKKQIDLIFAKEKPEIIVHFAAESHVDRSISDATPFVETNIKGTQILVDASRKHKVQKFIFISTDEVYGEIANGKFNENSPIKPNSPYAASKAAADLLVQSYIRTYKFPAIIIRPSNNYGPWQYPEKLIPLAILRILGGGKVPVYGKGQNVREWLYVDDCARGIMAIMRQGKIGQIYNLGSACESKNLDTIKLLLKTLAVSQDRFEFVKDRLGHDLRYSLNSRKITKELSWKPNVLLAKGLKLTVDWSLKHQAWLKSKLKDINKLYKE
ncbi:MAG: dTDP-glucose 4,6-dehydratase [Candidatus Omnitrophica bacterium]|nr:dTDP-glucose 4,6-dehydratase [Candidatus Omnitrophota bacterium]MBU4303248.1 dTDP-glucose 4,6-dehydratase [Candidatus Omnitrophota bacterium]MBU4418400.1 dTDP-glucose 4,6-dehydratase [Candidatus Omnitrophota bacterium]MBU4467220.1 dTDP-glucose 4,6-dehydratase [Candidatus Omnitrophota bacterium]MCG2707289.1 dTDP-glucose 4,6-dehydratase [Candidatus Omnitrophota bacterium]